MNNFYSTKQKKYWKLINSENKRMIQSALRKGFALFDQHFSQSNMPQGKTSTSTFLHLFDMYQQKIINGHFINYPGAFYTTETKLYQNIHSPEYSAFSDEQKLFFEFILGLCRFAISIQLFIRFLHSLVKANILSSPLVNTQHTACPCSLCAAGSSFWTYLHHISSLGNYHVQALMEQTNELQKIDFLEVADTFFEGHPSLESLAKHVVSMHFIPKEKKFLALAQSLHWNGFGGNGTLLIKYKQLQPLLLHRVGYHTKGVASFNSLLKLAFKRIANLKAYANKTGVELLQKDHPPGKEIKIFDVGSGPNYLAASVIINELVEKGKTVSLAASEIDITSIIKLQEKQELPNNPLAKVLYFDLNDIGSISEENIPFDEFDAITAGSVLHHLGFNETDQAIKFFTKAIKPGGYILNPDVGSSRYYQALLVPANQIDREGYVRDWQEHNFMQTATQVSTTHSKIAYPLRNRCKNFPNDQIPLHTFTVYQVFKITTEKVQKLDSLWHQKRYEQADILVGIT